MPSAAGLYYFSQGEADLTRPPVILIHGAGGHHLYWPPQVRRMPGERLFAVDLPGHGKSAGVGQHTIGDYSSAVVEFMDALRLNRAVLVGHSMGGAVALDIAVRLPERVLGLVLVGSAAHMHVSPRLLRTAADPAKEVEAVQAIIQHSFAPETNGRLKELAEQRMSESRSSILYGDLRACDAFDLGEQASRVSTPTLIIFGSADRMVSPGAGRALADRIEGARMEVLPHAGHMVMLEQPERVAGLLSEFLQGLTYQPGK